MKKPEEPPKADLPRADPGAAPAQINPETNPSPVAIEAPLDLKAQRKAAREARTDRSDLVDDCYEVLDAVRERNEDGSGKSLDQLREETKLSKEKLAAALDELESLMLVERAVHAPSGTLIYVARPGIPATPVIP